MNRRDFVALTAVLLSARALAVTPPSKPSVRAAVLIGVNKSGDLPVLNAAAQGAKSMAAWLVSEGFDVTTITDDSGKVTVAQISNVIRDLVAKGNLDQLVVYFSGHGFVSSYAEYWMLSGAPQDPNEAISVLESVALAKQSRISNVVFISDACRSRPDSLGLAAVRGGLIFPNYSGSNSPRYTQV